MSVGNQASKASLDNVITGYATQLRAIMTAIGNLSLAVNGQGAGLAYLEGIGYSNTPNAANPGGVSDATLALNMVSYLNTVAGIYFGTATQATQFNFNQQLSQIWGGS